MDPVHLKYGAGPLIRGYLFAVTATMCVACLAAVPVFSPASSHAQESQPKLRLPKDDSPDDAETIQRLTASDSARVTAMAFSPDGRWLAAGMQNSFVILWDAATGKQQRVLEQFDGVGPIRCLMFSADGKHLLMTNEVSQSAFIINVNSGATVHEEKCKSSIFTAAFTPVGSTVAISDGTRTVTLFAVEKPGDKKVLGPFARDVNLLAFTPDAARLAVCFGRDTPDSVQVFSCKSGKAVWESKKSVDSPFLAMGFVLAGKALAAVDRPGKVRLFDTATGEAFDSGESGASSIQSGQRDAESVIALNAGKKALVCGSSNFTVLDLNEMQSLPADPAASQKRLTSTDGKAAVARNEDFVATAFYQDIRLYSATTNELLLKLPCGDRPADGLAISPDGTKAALCWDAQVALVRFSLEERRQAEREALLAKKETQERREAEKRASERAKLAAEAAEKSRLLAERKAAEAAQLAAAEAEKQMHIADKEAREQESRRRNTTPSWDGVDNLNELVEPFGGDMRAFVEFGTPDIAELAKGDRFDRIEAKKNAAKYTAAIAGKTFMWTANEYRCRDMDDEDDRGDEIKQMLMINLPFRVADEDKRLSMNVKIGNGKNEIYALMKDGSLKFLRTQQQVDEAEARNGALYIIDSEESFVQILVSGKVEDIKQLVREPQSHVVQFRLSDVGLRKPRAWGYYNKVAMNAAEGHYPWVQAHGLAQKAAGKDREGITIDFIAAPEAPELCMARIDAIEVARIKGDQRKVLFSVEAKEGSTVPAELGQAATTNRGQKGSQSSELATAAGAQPSTEASSAESGSPNREDGSQAIASTQFVRRLRQRPAPSDDPADDPGRIVESLQRTMQAKNLRPDTEVGRMLDAYRSGVPTWTKDDGTVLSIDTLGLPAIDWAKKNAVPAWADKDSHKTPFIGVEKQERGTRFTLAPTRIMEDLRCTISFLVIDVTPANASARGLDYLAAQIELYGGRQLELETSPAIQSDTFFDIWGPKKSERYTVTKWKPNEPTGHSAPAYGPLLFWTLDNEPEFLLLENLKVELPESFRAGCRELCKRVQKQREANGLRHLPMCR